MAYTATRASDGTWNVLDVPIMGELPAGVRRNDKPVDREWMQAAIERDKLRAAEGYAPPAHIGHHGKGAKTQRVGHFRLKRVGKHAHDGRQIDALFADLTGIPDEQYQRIKRGAIPYRSVEIHDFAKPEVQSLALLDDEVPFFRFPNLAIGEERAGSIVTETTHFAAADGPAVAMVAHGGHTAALFSFKEPTMADTTPDPRDAQIATLTAQIADLTAKLQAKTPDDPEDGLTDEERLKRNAPADPVKGKAAEMSATPDATEIAKLQAKVNAMEDREAQRVRAERVEKLHADAIAKLSGYPLSDKTRAHFKALAEQDETGALLSAAVDIHRTTARRDPPSTLDAASGGYAEADAPEVAKFSAQGGRALELARHHSASFDRYKRDGGSFDLKTYLDINVGADLAATKEA